MTSSPAPSPIPSPKRRPWRLLLLVALWLASVAVAARAGAFAFQYRESILRRLGRIERAGLLQTNLYAVGFQRVSVPIDGRYGGIAPLADGVLFASRSGRLWFVDSARTPRALALQVPINTAEFESDPKNAGLVDADIFAVKDLLTQSTPRGVRVIVSHNQWDAARDCYFLRVSVAELPVDDLLAGRTADWATLHDTRPCQPLGLLGGGQRSPTIGAGGRLAMLGADSLLLTTGIFISDAAATADTASVADPAYEYGKTLVIDLRTRTSRIFTTGHRNPQGLAVGADGRIWVSEHAARGGDELNQLVDGRDYGYPRVSYGTAYGSMDWPLRPAPGLHDGFERPTFAWVPSIGTSQLVVVEGPKFVRWRGDIVLASLTGQSLFRLHLEGPRVAFVEPIVLKHRFRDITETSAGDLVALAEDGYLVYFEPVALDAEDPGLIPRERGQLIAGRCQGCHTFEEGGANGIGPNLHGLVGRRIASVNGFRYSQALRDAGGRWTEESIRRFVTAPSDFAPGSSMEMGFALTDEEFGYLLSYLRSLR